MGDARLGSPHSGPENVLLPAVQAISLLSLAGLSKIKEPYLRSLIDAYFGLLVWPMSHLIMLRSLDS